jgi:hypothetical protein
MKDLIHPQKYATEEPFPRNIGSADSIRAYHKIFGRQNSASRSPQLELMLTSRRFFDIYITEPFLLIYNNVEYIYIYSTFIFRSCCNLSTCSNVNHSVT